MNHSNSNTFRLTNEQLLLVNILNTMYNDNLRHINSITETLNSLTQTNNQIRISLGQILNSNQNTYTNNTRRNNNRRRENTSANHIGRVMINNQPFVIDSISEYTIPRNRGYNRLDSYTQSVFNSFLQPVEIYPTQSQIEYATRRVVYCDIARPVNTSCPINCRCPVCRYDIRDYNNTSSEYFNSSGTTIDSSNNNLERNTTNNTTNNTRNRFNEENINENLVSSLENIFNTEIFDASGNYTTNPTDMLASLLINTLNRNINTR